MEKPNLNRMWETFIKVPKEEDKTKYYNLLYNDIRFKIQPVISKLIENNLINWYHFLIHNRDSGVPAPEGDNDLYFHIRFSFKDHANPEDILNLLPDYCVMTQHIDPPLKSVEGIDNTIIKNEEIEEAWRIIGEQSEWLLRMLAIHKEDANVSIQQVGQFLHYFASMAQLRIN